MAGSRSLLVLVLALVALVALAATVQADDAGSSITTPVAQSPVGDYDGADGGDALPDDDAEAPDAGSLGAPVSSTPGSDSTSEQTPTTTGSSTSSASSTIDIAGIAIAGTAVLVGYFML